jgi:1L-myo-inositol 1-phosphate cytidylyltransferase / CDP-L-myo-inositol myo-inositolphosphotransferase
MMVSGLSLARRAALSAHAARLPKVVLAVHASDEAAVRQELLQDERLESIVTVVAAAEASSPASVGSSSLPDAQDLVFALGDRVWSTQTMRVLTEERTAGVELVVLQPPSSAAPSGLFRVRASAMESLHAVLMGSSEPSATDPTQRREHRLEWCEVREASDVPAAERILLASLVKPTDGVISRNLNRKISMFFSRRLARYDVSPNHVTLVVFLLGIASGPLAYRGTYEGFVAGGFCYWFSAVLDGTDGELARLKYLGSPLGAWLDTITDDVVCLSYVVGVYLALARNLDQPHYKWFGIVGTTFFLATVLPRYYLMARVSGSGDYQKMAADVRPTDHGLLSRVALGLRDVVFRTDFLPFYAFMTAIFGVVPAFALPFAVGAVASSVDTAISFVAYRRGA